MACKRKFLRLLPHNCESEGVQPGSWECWIFSAAPRFLSIRFSGCSADVNATIRPGYVRDSLSVSEPPPPPIPLTRLGCIVPRDLPRTSAPRILHCFSGWNSLPRARYTRLASASRSSRDSSLSPSELLDPTTKNRHRRSSRSACFA